MQAPALEIDRPHSTTLAVIVRQAEFSDYDAVFALMQRHGMETKKRADWEGLWRQNPVYLQREGNWTIGWVLESHEGVVGFCGNIPAAYGLGDSTLTSAVTHAWVVDAAYRRYSMMLASKYFAQKHVDLLLNTTAIHEAGRIFRAFHAKPVPVDNLDVALFWIIDFVGFAGSVLRRKHIPLSGWLRYPFGWLLRIIAWKRTAGKSGLVPVKLAYGFDERFDEFWQKVRTRKDVLMAARDQETLEWHFQSSLKSKNVWIYTREREGQLVSYAVFYREDKPQVSLKRVRLVDFQSLDADADSLTLTSMIAAALHQCKSAGVQMLEVVGFAGVTRKILEDLAPFKRTLPSWLFYYKAVAKEFKARLQDPTVWQPSPYDGDSSL